MSTYNERIRRRLLLGLLRLLRLEWLSNRVGPRVMLAIFTFINGGLSITLVSLVALAAEEPFIFPSLGASAFILFYEPLSRKASPRNTLLGHLTGALTGLAVLYLFSLQNAPSAYIAGMDLSRAAATGLALAATGSLMVLFRVVHPPAGATALIVTLGLMPEPQQVPILMAGVVMLVIHAFVVNRLSGIPYPLWGIKSLGST